MKQFNIDTAAEVVVHLFGSVKWALDILTYCIQEIFDMNYALGEKANDLDAIKQWSKFSRTNTRFLINIISPVKFTQTPLQSYTSASAACHASSSVTSSAVYASCTTWAAKTSKTPPQARRAMARQPVQHRALPATQRVTRYGCASYNHLHLPQS